MKEIKVVIGANFGDEGKGLMTDYFSRNMSPDKTVVNVRFNGGAQAGHTVVMPNGDRHVFSHFGSGSFNRNVITYLSSHFIVNPILFVREYDLLKDMGITPSVRMSENCIVTIPVDMMINQIVEERREGKRHGSCGVGIYETVNRNRSVAFRITARDMEYPSILLAKMTRITKAYMVERFKQLGVEDLSLEESERLLDDGIFNHYLEDVKRMMSVVFLTNDKLIMGMHSQFVFEGAQGLLLDQSNDDYFPHLTPSNTGLKNVVELLKHTSDYNIEVCYVTRTYMTRHGAGRFDTECPMADINGFMEELTNVYNQYQHHFRYGWFDVELFNKTVMNDMRSSGIRDVAPQAKFCVAFTHADETGNNIVAWNSDIALDDASSILLPIHYIAAGPSHLQVNKTYEDSK